MRPPTSLFFSRRVTLNPERARRPATTRPPTPPPTTTAVLAWGTRTQVNESLSGSDKSTTWAKADGGPQVCHDAKLSSSHSLGAQASAAPSGQESQSSPGTEVPSSPRSRPACLQPEHARPRPARPSGEPGVPPNETVGQPCADGPGSSVSERAGARCFGPTKKMHKWTGHSSVSRNLGPQTRCGRTPPAPHAAGRELWTPGDLR